MTFSRKTCTGAVNMHGRLCENEGKGILTGEISGRVRKGIYEGLSIKCEGGGPNREPKKFQRNPRPFQEKPS